MTAYYSEAERPHVVIIGGGFGGLEAAKAMQHLPVRITLIDKENHHLFQPLLYQVATAGLSAVDIAIPIRNVLRGQENLQVVMATVERIDPEAQEVFLKDGEYYNYDFLIIAAGARTSYFGHGAEWSQHAPGLKTIEDALEIRRRVLLCFEKAARAKNEHDRRELLTFVVVGGGPTGVELAGAFAELGRRVLADDYPNIRQDEVRVVLVEGADRLLTAFDTSLSEDALQQLQELGVEVRFGNFVKEITRGRLNVGGRALRAGTIVWAAGVAANGLAQNVSGAKLDGAGRIHVNQDCSLPDHPNTFAVGDIARFEENGEPLPGVSPVAMQQGRFVAEAIARTMSGIEREPFTYFDKGIMATVGRSRAVAQAGSIKMSGTLAWFAWLFVHIFYLVGFKNRVFVLLSWVWSYVFSQRGARLITGRTAPVTPKPRLRRPGRP